MTRLVLLSKLAAVFAMLSLLAVGGGTAVLPEMQSIMHQVFGLSADDFVRIYGLGQLAPGPNMLMVIVLGYKIARVAGVAVVGAAFFVPSSLLCLWTGRLWNRIGDTPWRRTIQNAMLPISIGLMCSGVWAVARESILGPFTALFALVVAVVMLCSKTNPVLLIVAAGVAGGFLFSHGSLH